MKTTFLALLLLGSLCLGAQIAPNHRLLFTATLTGGQQVPQVSTEALGLASAMLSADRSSLTLHGVFRDLSGPVTACHFHVAPPAANGPVLLDLSGFVTGNRLEASLPVTPALLKAALAGTLYLNVHTAANPNGEIRGQLELQREAFFATVLTGSNLVPPVATTAAAAGFLAYNPGSFSIRYFFLARGLSGPITAARIHDGTSGNIGPVVVNLSVVGPNTATGEISITAVPPDFIPKLENKGLYVSLSTAANPNGELRGQLEDGGPTTFEGILNGDQQVPPLSTGAIGLAMANLNPTLDTLQYVLLASGMNPTAAHLHQGGPTQNGPVLLDLQPTALPNLFVAKTPVGNDLVTNLFLGQVYANVHSAAHPDGQIRATLQPNLRVGYAFDLCGSQQVPPVASAAQGSAYITHDRLNTHLTYRFVTTGLSGPATAAHLHEAAFGANGPVYAPLNLPNPLGSGQWQITGLDAQKLASGNLYLNVHTANFPDGEIRGQVRQSLSCSGSVATDEPWAAAPTLQPNPVSGQALLRFSCRHAFEGQIRVSDPSGRVFLLDNQRFEQGEQALALRTEALAPGLYFVQISSAEGRVLRSLRLVKVE
jgi:hypothetical protein